MNGAEGTSVRTCVGSINIFTTFYCTSHKENIGSSIIGSFQRRNQTCLCYYTITTSAGCDAAQHATQGMPRHKLHGVTIYRLAAGQDKQEHVWKTYKQIIILISSTWIGIFPNYCFCRQVRAYMGADDINYVL